MEGSSCRFYISPMELVAEMQLGYLKLAGREIKFKKENVAPKDNFLSCFVEGMLGLI